MHENKVGVTKDDYIRLFSIRGVSTSLLETHPKIV